MSAKSPARKTPVKKPAARKPAARKTGAVSATPLKPHEAVRVTLSGKQFDINTDYLSTWDFIEEAAEADENPVMMRKVLINMLDTDGYENMKQISMVDGRVRTEKMMENFGALMQLAAKN